LDSFEISPALSNDDGIAGDARNAFGSKTKPMNTALHANCDVPAARLAKPAIAPARPNFVLVTTILASSLAFVDGSVVNVGLPTIGRDLSADAGALQWVINAYLLPLSALLLLGGAAGDRFGRRRLLIVGIVLFALASLACAAAPLTGCAFG
jgi:hypothetical protein